MSQLYKSPLNSGPLPPSIPTQFTEDSGVAVPVANNLNIFGGNGIVTSGAGSTVTISVVNLGLQWSDQALSFAAAAENGYFCTAGLTVSLPAAGSLLIGNTVVVYADTAAPVIIQAAVGEFIRVGANISGASGTATSNTRGAILVLVYRASSSTWHAVSSLGTWSLS